MQNEGLKWFGIPPRPKPLSLSLAVTPFSLMSEVCGLLLSESQWLEIQDGQKENL